MIATISSAAPSPRGIPCLRSQATSGEATAATIPAASSGSTITCVSASSHTIADEEHRDADQQPGREADVAQPLRDGEDPGQLAGIDLDVLLGLAGPAPHRGGGVAGGLDHVRCSVGARSDCAGTPTG